MVTADTVGTSSTPDPQHRQHDPGPVTAAPKAPEGLPPSFGTAPATGPRALPVSVTTGATTLPHGAPTPYSQPPSDAKAGRVTGFIVADMLQQAYANASPFPAPRFDPDGMHHTTGTDTAATSTDTTTTTHQQNSVSISFPNALDKVSTNILPPLPNSGTWDRSASTFTGTFPTGSRPFDPNAQFTHAQMANPFDTDNATSVFQRRPPTSRITEIALSIAETPIDKWQLRAFQGDKSSDGTSLLLSLVVDTIEKQYIPTLNERNLGILAQQAAFRNPVILLRWIKDPQLAIDFATDTLHDIGSLSLPCKAEEMCPATFPHLLLSDQVRTQLATPTNLDRSGCMSALIPFVHCLYPGDYNVIRAKLKFHDTGDIQPFINTPGKFHTAMIDKGAAIVYSPPFWVDLSKHSSPNARSIKDILHSDTHNNPTLPRMRIPEEFDVMESIGMDIQAFETLTTSRQKTIILTTLPNTLQTFLTQSEALDVIEAISRMPEEEVQEAIQHAAFRDIFFPLPLLPYQKRLPTKRHTTDIEYEYRFRLKFPTKTNSTATTWGTSAGKVLHTWLTAILPLLRKHNLTLTLIKAPAEVNRDPALLSTGIPLPSEDVLEHYIYDCHRDNSQHPTMFDFWFVSTCADLGSGSRYFSLKGATAQHYFTALVQGYLWPQRMEVYQHGYTPCLLLEHSHSRDSNEIIKQEYMHRLITMNPAHTQLDRKFQIAWYCIRAESPKNTIPIKCVMALAEHHTEICTAFATLPLIETTRAAIVTRHYKLTSFPPATSQGRKDLHDIIARQREYINNCICTTISGLGTTHPYTLIPPRSEMLGSSRYARNSLNVLSLIMEESLRKADGTIIKSPVLQVFPDERTHHLHLCARSTDAAQLVEFTKLLATPLAQWFGTHIDKITIDTSDAEKQITTMTTQTPHPTNSAATFIPAPVPQNNVWVDTEGGTLKQSPHTTMVLQQDAHHLRTSTPIAAGHGGYSTSHYATKTDLSTAMTTLEQTLQTHHSESSTTLRTILGQHTPTHSITPDEVTSIVSSSITSANQSWMALYQDAQIAHKQEMKLLAETFKAQVDTMRDTMAARFDHITTTLTSIISHYEAVAVDYGTMSHATGNELILSRVAMETFADNVKTLVHDFNQGMPLTDSTASKTTLTDKETLELRELLLQAHTSGAYLPEVTATQLECLGPLHSLEDHPKRYPTETESTSQHLPPSSAKSNHDLDLEDGEIRVPSLSLLTQTPDTKRVRSASPHLSDADNFHDAQTSLHRNFCYACMEDGGNLIRCEGTCLAWYHITCCNATPHPDGYTQHLCDDCTNGTQPYQIDNVGTTAADDSHTQLMSQTTHTTTASTAVASTAGTRAQTRSTSPLDASPPLTRSKAKSNNPDCNPSSTTQNE